LIAQEEAKANKLRIIEKALLAEQRSKELKKLEAEESSQKPDTDTLNRKQRKQLE